jgi:hypothetical protein
MRVDAATKNRGSQLNDGTGSTGLGFKTQTHLAPDLLKNLSPFGGLPRCGGPCQVVRPVGAVPAARFS